MADLVQSSEIEEVVKLLVHYSFDLGGESIAQLLERWLKSYPFRWLRPAIIEALYQGRYKAVSVEQIMMLWIRRGQPLFHFNSEFERIVGQRFPNPSRLALKQQPQWSLPAAPKVDPSEPKPTATSSSSFRPATPTKIQTYSTSPSQTLGKRSSRTQSSQSLAQSSQSLAQSSQTNSQNQQISTIPTSHSPVLPYSVLISKRIDQVSSASQSLGLPEEQKPGSSLETKKLGSDSDEVPPSVSASEPLVEQPDSVMQPANQSGILETSTDAAIATDIATDIAIDAQQEPTHDEPLIFSDHSSPDNLRLEQKDSQHRLEEGHKTWVDGSIRSSREPHEPAIALSENGSTSDHKALENSECHTAPSNAAPSNTISDVSLAPTAMAIAPESPELSAAQHQNQAASHAPEKSHETHPAPSSITSPTRDLTATTQDQSEPQADHQNPSPMNSDDPQPTPEPLEPKPLAQQPQARPIFQDSMVLKEKTDPIAQFVPKGQASQLYAKLRSVIQKPTPQRRGSSVSASSPNLPSLVEAIAQTDSDRPTHDRTR